MSANPPSHPTLSRRERQIMDILHARTIAAAERRDKENVAGGGGSRGPASVADVLAQLPDPPSYSAVRALLRILEEKGHVRHKKVAHKYLYEPTTPPKVAAKSALRRLLETFFAGSIERALATHLADPDTRLSPEELQRLTTLLDQARKRDRS